MTQEFIKKKLKEYYEKKGVSAPHDIEKREFGFGDIKKIDYRHIAFTNEEDLKRHFVENSPLYASFSSGYYEFPAGRPMEKKQFMGADLIFEFDAEEKDCINHNHVACEVCLNKTKEDSIRLIEEFLIPDFGFDKKDIRVSFSGNRGYHIYVVNEYVKMLNAIARREIVDYVQGNSFDFNKFVKGNKTTKGWGKRFTLAALKYAKDSKSKKFEDKQRIEKEILDGNLDLFKGASNTWEKILQKARVSLNADIDKSVTLDLARLIRLPSTVHGGSSLLCEYVDNLDSYNPFKDAVVFYNVPVKTKFETDVGKFVLKEETFGPFKKEQTAELPEYVAMLLACKGKAEVFS